MLSFGKGAGKPVAVRGNSGISSPTRPLNKSANAKRLLIVTLVEARDLVAVNTSDATSDPYVTLSLAINDVDIREEKMHMSSIKKRTIHPEYNETFTFGENCNLRTESDSYSLLIRVFHKRSIISSDEPLGVVRIPLVTIDAMGEEADAWYDLSVAHTRIKNATGQVHVKMRFSGPAPVNVRIKRNVETGNATEDLLQLQQDLELSDEEGLGTFPNDLTVVVCQARGLREKEGFLDKGAFDPYVKLKINGYETKRTEAKHRSSDPTWNCKVNWEKPLYDGSLSLTCHVKHTTSLNTTEDLGTVVVPLNHYSDQMPSRRWYKLLNKKGEDDGIRRGDLELVIHWKYNSQKSAAKRGRFMKWIMSESDEESGEDVVDQDEELERPAESREDREARAKALEERHDELHDVEIKSGDYQVQVHIIEARDLKAENLDGTSDPVCYIEALGERKQNTTVKKRCTSCVYDELFIFNIRNLDKETFEEGVIKITCLDSNSVPMLKEKMIGGWQIDAAAVYFGKHHELYRQWVPLMDEEDAEDIGVQGYLKVSVMVIGPGDKLYVHDEDAERAAEIAKEEESGGDIGSLVLMPPMVTKEWMYLVVSVYRAEALPVMDGAFRVMGVTASKAGTDAFFTVQFGGGPPIRTRTKTVSGKRSMINPEFFYELWYPVSVPTMTQMIKCAMWDWDLKGSELIANCTAKLGDIQRTLHQRTDVHWVNLYGAPEFKDANLVKNVEKMATKIKSTAKSKLRGERKYKVYYNSVPEKASSFKGRVLLRFSIKKEQERPPKYLKGDIKPFRVKIKKIQLRQQPHQIDYVLRAIFVSAANCPGFPQISATGAVTLGAKKQDLRLKVSIGHHEVCSTARPQVHGSVQWQESRISETFLYPSNVKQLPDIFVHLLRENDDPVCFTRFKPYDRAGNVRGFLRPAEWILLQEDKCIDALRDGQFPGQALIKIGFGPAEEAEMVAVKNEWDDAMIAMSTPLPHEVRVHLYQAKSLSATDAAGLSDPYVVVKIKDQKQTSRVAYKTLFPAYYQTFVFDMPLPDIEFADQVDFLVFDHSDLDFVLHDEHLGSCSVNLKDAFFSEHDAELPDPTWIDLFHEVPGDGEGALLVSVQVIRKSSPSEIFPPPASIVPATKRAYVEVIALGVRDMTPFKFVPMQCPFLEIQHFAFAEKPVEKAKFKIKVPGRRSSAAASDAVSEELLPRTYMAELKTVLCTKTSKKPNPANPNFLEKMLMEVTLPENAIFAQPLLIKAKDSRLGGYLTPTVGVGTIDMVSKIPWFEKKYDEYGNEMLDMDESGKAIPPKIGHPSTYRPPGDNMVSADALAFEDPSSFGAEGDLGAEEDVIARAARKLRENRLLARDEENIATLDEEMSIEELIQEKIKIADTGAGIFGALTHMKAAKAKKYKKMDMEKYFTDPDWTQDDGDSPPKWAVGRKMIAAELETEFPGTPFETYFLTRGHAHGMLGSTVKVCGKFKCLVRVFEKVYPKIPIETQVPDGKGGSKTVTMLTDDINQECREEPPASLSEDLMETLLKPQNYEVRLYALKATNLTGMNVSISGKPGNSDPYLRVTLGKFVFDDRENAVDDVKETDLYKVIIIKAELPGASQLAIEVMDKNTFSSDALIGKTVIDLEDRWFDARWQALGIENRKETDDGAGERRWDTKPIENRSLYVPSNAAGQGIFQCYLDILTTNYAQIYPPDNVSLPPTQMFEVRIVIWKTKGVPPMDSFEGMSDLFVKCWPEGCAAQDTDIHWRCKKGKASFNYRMKFDVELGHNTRAMKFPYLHVQLWDKDLLKWSDCAGEVHIDVGKYYRKAYKRNIAIKLFEKKKGVQARRAMRKPVEELEEEEDIGTEFDDIPPEDVDGDEDARDDLGVNHNSYEDDPMSHPDVDEVVREVNAEGVEEEKSVIGDQIKLVKKKSIKSKDQANTKNDGRSWLGRLLGFETAEEKKKRLLKERKDRRKKLQEEAALRREKERREDQEREPLLMKEEEERKRKEEEEDDLKSTISWVKNTTGLWDDDPDDSDWLHIEKHDHNNPGKPESMGYICYSMQIWPKDKAETMPVGTGRAEPNMNPFCPPPVGRLRFTLNPFVMGSQLCGPKLCFYFTCCLMCAGFILLMVFCAPALNIVINLIFFFGIPH